LEIQLEEQQLCLLFAPQERDDYGYQRTPKVFAPLGAKPVKGTFAGAAGKSDCAPMELRSKERAVGYKHLAPLGRSTNNIMLHFQLESAKEK
jgi:hypothetical protein